MLKKFIKRKTSYFLLIFIFISFSFLTQKIFAQTEVEPWGNITGIRVDGQLMEFETSLRVINNDWSQIKATAQEHQQPKFIRDGNKQTITTKIDSFYFKENVTENIPQHEAKINVQFTSKKDTDSSLLYFCIQLPAVYYKNGSVIITNQNKQINMLYHHLIKIYRQLQQQ